MTSNNPAKLSSPDFGQARAREFRVSRTVTINDAQKKNFLGGLIVDKLEELLWFVWGGQMVCVCVEVRFSDGVMELVNR